MKRPVTVISLISILLFTAALVWFGRGIYADGKAGKEQNTRAFETLFYKTIVAADQSRIGTTGFSKKFSEAIGNIDNYSYLRLEVNGKAVYSYPPVASDFSLPSASLINSFKESRTTRNGLLITLSASMYAIKAKSVYHYAKLAFVLILLGTSIAFVSLMLLSIKKDFNFTRKDKTKKKPTIEEEFNINYGDDDSPLLSDIKDSTQDKEVKAEEVNEEKVEDASANDDEQLPEEPAPAAGDLTEARPLSEEQKEETDFTEPVIEENETLPEQPVTPAVTQENDFEEPVLEKEDFEEPAIPAVIEEEAIDKDKTLSEEPAEEQKEEQDVFEEAEPVQGVSEIVSDINVIEQTSPVTGLKLQSCLLEELNAKIKAAFNNERELTLALLKVNGLDRGNFISDRLIKILEENIQDRNRIYEYNADGYAIVLEDTATSACADIFDRIYAEMTSYLKSNNSINEVVIGLSSLHKREINSEQLLKEADKALSYALEDPDSPIIAFRS